MSEKRKPTDPIGVDDYVGTVGNEKHAVHKTHWHSLGVKLKGESGSAFVWVKTGAGRWTLKKKENENG